MLLLDLWKENAKDTRDVLTYPNYTQSSLKVPVFCLVSQVLAQTLEEEKKSNPSFTVTRIEVRKEGEEVLDVTNGETEVE